MDACFRSTVLAFLACGLGGCLWPQPAHNPLVRGNIQQAAYEQTGEKTVYVVGHGWHTGVVLPVKEISPEIWPEVEDYRTLDYVEFGWGDEGFYRAEKITPSLVAKAALLPTPSVMHVAGFPGTVLSFYDASDVIEVRLDDDEFDGLCRFISNSFARDSAGQSESLGAGLYGASKFYRAEGKYYLPKTCNIWTAKALRAAGRPVSTPTSLTAESVLRQSRGFGRELQQSPQGIKQAALGHHE
jgi:uncharacterized protein (TIGR02117 family)